MHTENDGQNTPREVIHRMSAVMRKHHAAFDALREETGLGRSAHYTLMRLSDADNVLSQTEIAGILEISTAAVTNMLKRLEADGFVSSFADGYGHGIERGGANVSGGQKQRLCIARALLKKPKILILDDSTSAVDTATEAKIREAFRTDLCGSTKIIIAQRVTSVMDADRILVLEDGSIAGLGTHDELMQSCEEYKEIYSLQMENKEAKQNG